MTESSGGIGLAGALFLLFLGLKLAGIIAWPWVWVFAPVWIPVLIALLIVLGILTVSWVKVSR